MGLSWGKERKHFATEHFPKQVPSQHGPLLGQAEETFRDRPFFKTSPLSPWASLGARKGNILRQRNFKSKSPLSMGLSWGKGRQYFTTRQFSKQVPSQHGPLLGQGGELLCDTEIFKASPLSTRAVLGQGACQLTAVAPRAPNSTLALLDACAWAPLRRSPPQNAKSAIAGGRSLRFRMLAARPPCVSAGGRALRSPMFAAVAWAHTSGTEHEARLGKRCRFVTMRGAHAGDDTPLRSVPTQNNGSGELPEPIAGVQLFPGGRARQKNKTINFRCLSRPEMCKNPASWGLRSPQEYGPPSPRSATPSQCLRQALSLSLSLSLSSCSGD